MTEEAAAAPQKPEEARPPLEVGDIVAEKYRVDEVVGQGAMGYVFAAEHTHLGHRVALKVLRAGALEHKESVERFLREGRIVARIQSEHVARVSDVGTLKSGVPYLVMEFLEGSDLSKILKQRGEPLSLGDAVDFTLQVCEALAHAHALGVVHRDLKPANLYVTTRLDGSPLLKVLDFGISKSSTYGEGQDELTVTAALMGTPRYMSPEQIHDSRLVDSRTDIWALGTIIYEMLTLERCFQAPSVAMTCVKILQQEPPALSSLRPDLPPQIEAIVAKCLQKDPHDRWAHVGELAEAIAPLGNSDAAAVAARIYRIATTPPDMKHTGARSVLAATGSFSAATSLTGSGSNPIAPGSLRLTGTGSSPAFVANSPSASPGASSPLSDSRSQSGARGSAASVPNEPPQAKRGKGVLYGGVIAALVVIGIVFVAKGGKSPETTSPAAQPSVSQVATASATVSAEPSVSASATETAKPTVTYRPRWTPPPKPTTTATATATTAAPTATTPPKPTGGDILDDRH